MPEIIHVRRESTEVPFGFKLQGGADFAMPLHISSVTPHSVADYCGLRAGDSIIQINNVKTASLEHSNAKMEIVRAGNEITLIVVRNAIDTSKPQYAPTPLSKLRSKQPVNFAKYSAPPPAPKTDLTIQKPESISIGSSHNRAPMPFNAQVGTSIEYKSAKPTNWKQGDYTQWLGNDQANNSNPQSVKAVFHNQYNTPIGMYSDSNVLEEFQHQTKGIIPENMSQNPAKASAYQNSFKPAMNPAQPRGTDSLSMRMLNSALDQSTGTIRQPPSVFDLKYGHNPTGATVPKGFKSVLAPSELPPEQRHAPIRTEYQVKQVKQNWIEPKIH